MCILAFTAGVFMTVFAAGKGSFKVRKVLGILGTVFEVFLFFLALLGSFSSNVSIIGLIVIIVQFVASILGLIVVCMCNESDDFVEVPVKAEEPKEKKE